MRVILEITSGPALGRKIHLQAGQVAQFGRTEWADFGFPEDADMADIHFVVECDSRICRIRDFNSKAGTLVNQESVDERILRDGDQIVAGQTTFAVQLEGALMPASADSEQHGQSPGGSASDSAADEITAAELCEAFELEEESQALLDDSQSPRDFLDLLVERELFRDAVRVLARWLPKREAVWWACLCADTVADRRPAPELEALEAARQWVIVPDEDNRRAAMTKAENAEFDGPGAWAALGAFWNSGSIAPPNSPEVPPAPDLTAKAVASAVMISGIITEPQKANEKYRQFIDLGIAITQNEHPWPAE